MHASVVMGSSGAVALSCCIELWSCCSSDAKGQYTYYHPISSKSAAVKTFN